MAVKSSIEWTDSTWNPVTGCSKVSAGCKHCYAAREWPRMTKLVQAYAGRDFTDVRTHGDRLDQPLRWKRPRRIFVNSMSDLFHPDVPDAFIDRVFAVMALAHWHTFQVLTKRPQRMNAYFSNLSLRAELVGIEAEVIGSIDRHTEGMQQRWPLPLPNVWLGVSVEDQATADERIPLLLETPAAVRWISAEPLLERVDLTRLAFEWDRGLDIGGWKHCSAIGTWGNALTGEWCSAELIGRRLRGAEKSFQSGRLDWVVVGGESGPDARPMHPAYALGLRDQCAAAGIPFLFKQWGEWAPAARMRSGVRGRFADGGLIDRPHELRYACYCPDITSYFGERFVVERVGKKAAGRLLDGVQHDAYPQAVK